MSAILHKLGNVRIPRRVGLAAMTFAAILPVGLSAVGNTNGAQIAASVGVPVVLFAALAWRGGKSTIGTKAQLPHIVRQKQAIVLACFALLASVLWSDWPREAAIYGSVALNRDKLRHAAIQARAEAFSECRWLGYKPDFALHGIWLCNGSVKTEVDFRHECHAGFVEVSSAKVNYDGDVILYTEVKNREGRVQRQAIYVDKGLGH